jgi:hypothetical protein
MCKGSFGEVCPVVLILTVDEFELVEEMVKKKAAEERTKEAAFPGEFVAVGLLPEIERARAQRQQAIEEALTDERQSIEDR